MQQISSEHTVAYCTNCRLEHYLIEQNYINCNTQNWINCKDYLLQIEFLICVKRVKYILYCSQQSGVPCFTISVIKYVVFKYLKEQKKVYLQYKYMHNIYIKI